MLAAQGKEGGLHNVTVTRIVVAFLVLAMPWIAYGQAGGDSSFVFGPDDYALFPDGDRVILIGGRDLVFETQVAPDVRIYSNLNNVTRQVFERDSKSEGFRFHWGFSAFGTIMIRLRMFDEPSNPVKTPSFMPKGTIQIVGFRSHADPHKPENEIYKNSLMSMLAFTTVPFGHHSNGQSGCVFADFNRNEEGVCAPTSGITSDDLQINTKDGSFSTNYIRGGVHYRLMQLDDSDYIVRWQLDTGFSLEYHPCDYGAGALAEELRSRYGQRRFGLKIGYAHRNVWKLGRLDLRYQREYIGGAGEVDPTHSFSILALPKTWSGFGFYGRYYTGRDYYNIGFEERITRVDFGFAFNGAQFFNFDIPVDD